MLRFETILCPVDFSECSALALNYAVQLARQYAARLVVFHAVTAPVAVPVFPDRLQGALPQMEETHDPLEEFLRARIPEDLPIVKCVQFMSPAAGILRTAEDEHCDLIVMGTHGTTGYEALLLGSVTHKVLHKSTIPILTVCKPARDFVTGDPETPVRIRKILCAVEPTQLISLRRIHLALSLARSFLADLLFLQVWESMEQEPTLEELKDLIQPGREEWCKSVEFLKERGNAMEEIVKAASLHEVDLVVVGHHIRRSSTLEVLGSVAGRVISLSPCPVLVVRD